MGNRSYQLTRAGRSAHGWLIGRHWFAGNSYFPCGRIFIFYFSEPLDINIEVLNSLLLWKGLFIWIYFDRLWVILESQKGTQNWIFHRFVWGKEENFGGLPQEPQWRNYRHKITNFHDIWYSLKSRFVRGHSSLFARYSSKNFIMLWNLF